MSAFDPKRTLNELVHLATNFDNATRQRDNIDRGVGVRQHRNAHPRAIFLACYCVRCHEAADDAIVLIQPIILPLARIPSHRIQAAVIRLGLRPRRDRREHGVKHGRSDNAARHQCDVPPRHIVSGADEIARALGPRPLIQQRSAQESGTSVDRARRRRLADKSAESHSGFRKKTTVDIFLRGGRVCQLIVTL